MDTDGHPGTDTHIHINYHVPTQTHTHTNLEALRHTHKYGHATTRKYRNISHIQNVNMVPEEQVFQRQGNARDRKTYRGNCHAKC